MRTSLKGLDCPQCATANPYKIKGAARLWILWTMFYRYIAKDCILYIVKITLSGVLIGVDSLDCPYCPRFYLAISLRLLAAGHKVYGYCGQPKN